MSLSFNIAIDGYSSCGKSTIAKSIASKYGMRYIDTGAMYRAVTLYCMRNGIIKNQHVDIDQLLTSLINISINFDFNSRTEKSETILNAENVEDLIRGIDVSDNVSIIAQIKQVREKLIVLQQNIGRSKNVVIGFGITEKTIKSLRKADGLVVGSSICKEITRSIKKRQNTVTNINNMVRRLKNKIK